MENGVVVYINHERGYGYIKSDGREKVVVSRKFVGGQIFDQLRPDQRVQFNKTSGGGVEPGSLSFL